METMAAAASLAPRRVPRPKRPLSAFNLFYRFKRQKVLDLQASGDAATKEDITALVEAAPGLEHTPASETEGLSEEEVNELRKANIRKDLEDNLLPRDTRDRQHRTNASGVNGALSFVELGKAMNAAWKECDEFAKSVFGELADEGRNHYHARMREYHEANRQFDLTAYGRALAVHEAEEPPAKRGRKKGKKKRGSTDSADSADGAHPSPGSVLDGPGDPNEAALHARVRHLEGQLAAERLRLRVQELENALVRQRAVEGELRAQVAALVNGGGGHPMGGPMGNQMGNQMGMHANNMGGGGMGANNGVPQGGGLWNLTSAAAGQDEGDGAPPGKKPRSAQL